VTDRDDEGRERAGVGHAEQGDRGGLERPIRGRARGEHPGQDRHQPERGEKQPDPVGRGAEGRLGERQVRDRRDRGRAHRAQHPRRAHPAALGQAEQLCRADG